MRAICWWPDTRKTAHLDRGQTQQIVWHTFCKSSDCCIGKQQTDLNKYGRKNKTIMVKKVRVQIIIIVTGRGNARGQPSGLLSSEEQKGLHSHETRSCADNHTFVSHLYGREVYFRINQSLWKLWSVTRSRLRELDQSQTTSLLLQLAQIYFVIYLNFGINLYTVAPFPSLNSMPHV